MITLILILSLVTSAHGYTHKGDPAWANCYNGGGNDTVDPRPKGPCVRYCEAAVKCWLENGAPGRAYLINLGHFQGGPGHRVFVVDDPAIAQDIYVVTGGYWCYQRSRPWRGNLIQVLYGGDSPSPGWSRMPRLTSNGSQWVVEEYIEVMPDGSRVRVPGAPPIGAIPGYEARNARGR
jgi:hypothetical protein